MLEAAHAEQRTDRGDERSDHDVMGTRGIQGTEKTSSSF